MLQQLETVSRELTARIAAAPTGINPKLVFKLQLHPKAHLDDSQLRGLGLHFLERDASRALVVFPDEASLMELRRRLQEYSGLLEDGHQYSYLAAIDDIRPLDPSDRTGSRLAQWPLEQDETAPLDIELFHTGDRHECREMVSEIRTLCVGYGQRVTDSWVGDTLVLVRGYVNRSLLDELLHIDYVREVERRPAPSFDMLSISSLDLSGVHVGDLPADDMPGVLVVDSGVMSAHPLLAPAMGEADVFPDRLRAHVAGGPEDADSGPGNGHGTAVAGIAVYGDMTTCVETLVFRPTARLFSARVTDERGDYDPESLIEHQLEEALRYFLSTYPSVKVVNISLGEREQVCRDKQLQFRFAAAIDEFAYRYRNRDVVFVVSAGNYWPEDITDEDMLRTYPEYLFASERSRIIDPGTSVIALTVGGLSYGAASQPGLFDTPTTDRLVAVERAAPSSFTRIGWGLNGSVKPDVVDFAGDQRFERGDVIPEPAKYAGVPTTARNFAPPDGRLLRTVAGTSFAAPRVANMAAQLFYHFPTASSNLVRALIASSARVPRQRPGRLATLRPWDEDILRVYGNGQPDLERARWSAENDVILLADDAIELDHFRLYTLPSLPDRFLESPGSGCLSVCLAYDPPTKRSRSDYLGVQMDFRLYRNVSPHVVAEKLAAATNEEFDVDDEENDRVARSLTSEAGMPTEVDLRPRLRRRRGGTLQRGMTRISSSNWKYNGEQFVLAIVCRRVWAPADITSQQYSLVATMEHEQPYVDIYNHARQQARVTQRVRLRAR